MGVSGTVITTPLEPMLSMGKPDITTQSIWPNVSQPSSEQTVTACEEDSSVQRS